MLAENYHSAIIDRIKADDFVYRAGRLTVHLAREFGFCYGVDRAVDYAYQTREAVSGPRRLPHRRNHPQPARQREAARDGDPLPHRRRRQHRPARPRRRGDSAGVRRHGGDARTARSPRLHAGRHDLRIGAERVEERPPLLARAATRRSSTARCGTRKRRPPRRRPSQYGGRYLVVFDHARSQPSSATTSGAAAPAATRCCDRFANATSPGFDPDRDLQRIGLANQTTMLMSESLEIGEMMPAAMIDRYGETALHRPLPGVRHDLQRHPGPAGRRGQPAAR